MKAEGVQSAKSEKAADPPARQKDDAAPEQTQLYSIAASLLRFQRSHGNRYVQQVIRAKLAVSQSGDPQKPRADHVAERIVNMRDVKTLPLPYQEVVPDKKRDRQKHFKEGQYTPGNAERPRFPAHEVADTEQQGETEVHTKLAEPVDASQYQVSRVAPSTIQRDGNPPGEPSTTKAPTLTVGPFAVTTFAALLGVTRLFKSQLTTDAADVPVGEPSRTTADDLVKQAQEWEPFLQSKGSDPLDQATVNQATVWAQAFKEAREGLEKYKKAKARADMEKAAAKADEARAAVDKIPGQMADYQRGAFLAKKHELLEHLTHTVGKALQVSSALLEIHEKCMQMVGWLSDEISHVDELVEKFGPIAELAHKVVATYEGLSSALTILRGGEGATEIDKATSKARAGLGLTEAAGSLIPMASAYMVYFGVLLSVGQECLRVVGVIIREHSHEFNQFFIASGELDSVDWSAEPGGRAAFDFMVVVMHAASSTDIPSPVPEAVDELMVESEHEFEKGTGEEVPTKGFWFWKHADPDKLKYWLMKNRHNVWAMLYGSISPPA